MTRKSERRRRHGAPAAASSRDNNTLIIAAVAVAVLFVGGLVALNLMNASAPPAAVNAARVWGSEAAPVKVEIFSDFQ